MVKLRELWERVRSAFAELGVLERRIVDVASWDGSAAQWDDTDAYCADCLIDVNEAAGRDIKAQSHCMLPVRRPSDDDEVYVRQAVYAAAGGHGISQVVRPDDVPSEAWGAAVRSAANELIAAYEQMDESAPDSVYNIAEREPSGEGRMRQLSMGQVWEQLDVLLEQQAEFTMPWVHDVYVDDTGELFVIVSDAGALYQAMLGVDKSGLHLGEWVPVEIEFAPAGARERHFWLQRQADGGWRWFAVTETAVLLRVGELDSRSLFDCFVAEAEERGYPELLFYHDDRLHMGQADWLAREGNCMLASGLLDDGPLAAAFVGSCERGELWGTSNGFHALDAPAMWEIRQGVTIPVYERGYLQEISVLPENRAASWFTTIGARQEVSRMRTEVADALKRLFGDERAAEDFIAVVDETNREIEERGLVTRDGAAGDDTTEELETEAVAEATATTTEEADKIEVTDELLDALAQRIPQVDGAAILAGIEELKAKVDEVAAARQRDRDERDQLATRVAELERSDEEKRSQWLADLPTRRVAVYRPKVAHADEPEATTRTSEDIAAGTLAALRHD